MSNTVCPQCGAPVDLTAGQCKYCGEKLQPQQISAQQVQPAPIQPPQYQTPPQTPSPQHGYLAPGIQPEWPIKNKIAAGLLAIFLGGFGIHKFYLGKIGQGILYLLFCWTYIPAIIGFFEGILYLVSNDHNFQVKNKVRIY